MPLLATLKIVSVIQWYYIDGLGTSLDISTCDSFGSIGTYIQVFKGTPCSSGLECESSQSGYGCSSSDLRSGGKFFGEVGEGYYIFVYGGQDEESARFTVTVTEYESPPNDECSGAIELPTGVTVTVSTKDALAGDDFDCIIGDIVIGVWYYIDGRGSGIDIFPCIIGDIVIGVWYYIDGRGSGIDIFPCDGPRSILFESRYVRIYRGSTCLSDLVCEASAVPYACSNSLSVGTRFFAEEGERYYMVVTGGDGERNRFNITATEFERAPNDFCEGAIELTTGVGLSGSMEGATSGDSGACSKSMFDSNPGVWYYLDGLGSAVEISVCMEASSSSYFSGGVHVLKGSNCSSELVCAESTETFDYPAGCSPGATFVAEEGERYYIVVHSNGGGQEGLEGAAFVITATEFDRPTNDDCSGAIKLTPGVTQIGTVEGATILGDSFDCLAATRIPAVWYHIDGTGSGMEVFTCDPTVNTTFTGSIFVLKGSTCLSELECQPFLASADCPLTDSPSVKFLAEEGEQYYILVFGYYREEGKGSDAFTITATEFETVGNDVCEGAYSIDKSNKVIEGTTIDATLDRFTCGQSYFDHSAGPGVWYTFEGTGIPMMVSTCSSMHSTEPTILVFSGSCDQLSCVAYGSPGTCEEPWLRGSRVIIQTEVDTTYSIFISGLYTDTVLEDFGLKISHVDTAPNGRCLDATELISDDMIFGSTVNTFNPVPTSEEIDVGNSTSPICMSDTEAAGIWYSFGGTGEDIAFTTCVNGTNNTFYPSISIFSGSCDLMECILGVIFDPFACFTEEVAIFKSEVGVEYFIFVYGSFEGARGEFVLTVLSLGSVLQNDTTIAPSIAPDIPPDSGPDLGSPTRRPTGSPKKSSPPSRDRSSNFASGYPDFWSIFVLTATSLWISV